MYILFDLKSVTLSVGYYLPLSSSEASRQQAITHLQFVIDALVFEDRCILGGNTVVPATEDPTHIVEVKRPTTFNVVLLVGLGYTETRKLVLSYADEVMQQYDQCCFDLINTCTCTFIRS